jgi:ABC-type nitrate/sulfonate/bicarbonate transport system permease component
LNTPLVNHHREGRKATTRKPGGLLQSVAPSGARGNLMADVDLFRSLFTALTEVVNHQPTLAPAPVILYWVLFGTVKGPAWEDF